MPELDEKGPDTHNARLKWIRELREHFGLGPVDEPAESPLPGFAEQLQERRELLETADHLDRFNVLIAKLREALYKKVTPTDEEAEQYGNAEDAARIALVKAGTWEEATTQGKRLEELASRLVGAWKTRKEQVRAATETAARLEKQGMLSSRAVGLRNRVAEQPAFDLAFDFAVAVRRDDDKVGPMREWLVAQSDGVDRRALALDGTGDLTDAVTGPRVALTEARGKEDLRAWREALVPVLSALEQAERQAQTLAAQESDLRHFVEVFFPAEIERAVGKEVGLEKKAQRQQQLDTHLRNIREKWLPARAKLSRDEKLKDNKGTNGTLANITDRISTALGMSLGDTQAERERQREAQEWTAFTQQVHQGWVALSNSTDPYTANAWDRRIRGIFPNPPLGATVADRLQAGKTLNIHGGSYTLVDSRTTGMALHREIPEGNRPTVDMRSYIFHTR